MARSGFYRLGQIAGVQFRKAKWIWQSAAGSEADAIQPGLSVGPRMPAVVLEETPRDSDGANQALLEEIGEKLAPQD